MSIKSTSTERTTSEINDETSSSEEQKQKPLRKTTKKESIKNYVTDVLTKHDHDDEQQHTDSTSTQIEIATDPDVYRDYENVSAFRRYQSKSERYHDANSTSEDEIRPHTPTETTELEDSITELNLDPNPIREVRESHEKTYKQKVYLRQLQPPTPQPVEIQVQEVLIKPHMQKPPIHVRVGQTEPRTPSPILIKTAPPPAPPSEPTQPIVYNKYLPPPKQPPQQIIIHRYPDLPPKPRPIIVEQWLPYKPAPKRIIKHSLPRETLQAAAAPHNIIVSYSKPRALIEVELIRLPIVKIDPHAYEEISAGGEEQLRQHPTFQHEQNFLSNNRSIRSTYDTNQLNWRI